MAPGLCYGASDVDLADDPIGCAVRLRRTLPAHLPLFSSPLRRCRRLAEAIHASPEYDDRLRELDFGAWELRAWDDIARADLDAWAAAPMTYAPPGGESIGRLWARVTAFLDERVRPAREDCVLVTHAGVMRIVAAQLQGLPQAAWLGLRFPHGEVTVMQA